MSNETIEDANGILQQAEEYWRRGQALEAGRIVFENLPDDVRPRWASRILRLILSRSGIRLSKAKHTCYIAENPSEWSKAHKTFDALRDATLRMDRKGRWKRLSRQEKLKAGILGLAELVAKVTYNATNPQDEFDEDSGWWIVASLKGFVDLWDDDDFTKAAWDAFLNFDANDKLHTGSSGYRHPCLPKGLRILWRGSADDGDRRPR